MDNNKSTFSNQFDAIYTSRDIQILKIIFPFVEPAFQKSMAIYIKYMELKLSIDKLHTTTFVPVNPPPITETINSIYDALIPYLNDTEKERISKLKSTYESYKDTIDTINLFKEMQSTMSEEDMKEFINQGIGLF